MLGPLAPSNTRTNPSSRAMSASDMNMASKPRGTRVNFNAAERSERIRRDRSEISVSMRRKSTMTVVLETARRSGETAVVTEDQSLLTLFNFFSTNETNLRRRDDIAWAEFGAITRDIYTRSSVVGGKDNESLIDLLNVHGFSREDGWRRDFVDIDSLVQSFSNLYLASKSKNDNGGSTRLTTVKNIQALTFCPNILFANFPPVFDSKPTSRCFESAVLLADISGFSKFAGEMCLKGAKGLDVLHKVTSDFLGHFVHTVYDYDGDVIAFAGDALICIFPTGTDDEIADNGTALKRTIGDACVQALRCANELRDHKILSLSAHFAISCGPISVALLGGVNDEWTYLMNGACISELTGCIDNAPPQNIVCTRPTIMNALEAMPGVFTYIDVADDKALIISITKPSEVRTDLLSVDQRLGLEPIVSGKVNVLQERSDEVEVDESPRATNADQAVLLTQMAEKATFFIPRPVLNSMSVGTLDSIAELRNVTTMFLNLDSYSNVDNADPLTLQPFFLLLQEVLKQSGGFLRQFLIDDKGCVAIAMWGVPSYAYTNDCSRGLFCAWNMNTRVAEVNHRCSIGLTTGHAYCGTVGSSFRRDYACIGDKVNIAARLMAKAKGHVLVDPDVYAAVDSEDRHLLELWPTELKLKGMPAPITPYTFQADAMLNVLRVKAEDNQFGSNTIIRKDVVQQILYVLDQSVVGTPFLSKLSLSDKRYDNSDLNSAILVGRSNSSRNLSVSGKSSGKSTPPLKFAFSFGLAGTLQNMVFTSAKNIFTSSKGGPLSRQSSIAAAPAPTPVPEVVSSPSAAQEPKLLTNSKAQVAASPTRSKVVKHNHIIILTGLSGTGKSTAAKFFKTSSMRRKFKCAMVLCRVDDESYPYSIVRRFFWEMAGKDRFKTESLKKRLIADLVSDANADGKGEYSSNLEYSSLLQDILIDENENAKKRLTKFRNTNRRRSSLKPRGLGGDDESCSIDGGAMSGGFGRSISIAADDDDVSASFAVSGMGQESAGDLNMDFDMEESPDSNVTSEEINTLLVRMIQSLLSNHPSPMGLVIERAHYCDEMSWAILEAIQVVPMKLVVLLTTRNAKSHPAHEAAVVSRRSSAFGSALVEQKLAVNVSKRSISEVRAGQGFATNESYLSIINNPQTTVIEMLELNELEVGDVLRHVLGSRNVSTPLVKKVLSLTSGNAFWCKAIARYIKENGMADFTETAEKSGSSLDTLKNLIICRLEKVTPEQQIVIKHASVIGEEFSIRTLSAVIPRALFPNLKQSLEALVEMGFLYLVEEKPLTIYGFHNQLSRETIYEIIPPSDASDIHLAAARYIESKYSSNLRQFYHSLSYHYSFVNDHHYNAFKFTIKAADQSISKGAFRNGLELVKSVLEMVESTEELQIVLKVVDRGVKDVNRNISKHKSRMAKRKHFTFDFSKPNNSVSSRSGHSAHSDQDATDQVILGAYLDLKKLVENRLAKPTEAVEGDSNRDTPQIEVPPPEIGALGPSGDEIRKDPIAFVESKSSRGSLTTMRHSSMVEDFQPILEEENSGRSVAGAAPVVTRDVPVVTRSKKFLEGLDDIKEKEENNSHMSHLSHNSHSDASEIHVPPPSHSSAPSPRGALQIQLSYTEKKSVTSRGVRGMILRERLQAAEESVAVKESRGPLHRILDYSTFPVVVVSRVFSRLFNRMMGRRNYRQDSSSSNSSVHASAARFVAPGGSNRIAGSAKHSSEHSIRVGSNKSERNAPRVDSSFRRGSNSVSVRRGSNSVRISNKRDRENTVRFFVNVPQPEGFENIE